MCHNLDSTTKVGPGLGGLFNKSQLPNGNPVTDANLAGWIHSGGTGLQGFPAMPPFPNITGSQIGRPDCVLKTGDRRAIRYDRGTYSGDSGSGKPGSDGRCDSIAQSHSDPIRHRRGQIRTFENNCASCHYLDNTRKLGPGLSGMFSKAQLPNGQPVTDANVAAWINSGGGGLQDYPPMPPLPEITGQQMDNLLAFLKEASGGPSGTMTPTAIISATLEPATPQFNPVRRDSWGHYAGSSQSHQRNSGADDAQPDGHIRFRHFHDTDTSVRSRSQPGVRSRRQDHI